MKADSLILMFFFDHTDHTWNFKKVIMSLIKIQRIYFPVSRCSFVISHQLRLFELSKIKKQIQTVDNYCDAKPCHLVKILKLRFRIPN